MSSSTLTQIGAVAEPPAADAPRRRRRSRESSRLGLTVRIVLAVIASALIFFPL